MEKTLDIAKFNPTKAELTTLVEKYSELTITGVDDKAGYEAVDRARKDLKKHRVIIENTGKDLREEANKYAKLVIATEKELVAMVEPLEKALGRKQDDIDLEKEKIKRQKLLPERKEKLQTISLIVEDEFLLLMDDNRFTEFFNQANTKYLEEKQRLMREEQEKLETEKRKIQEAKEAQEREARHLAEVEQAKKDAAERSTLEAERKSKEEIERKEREEQQRIAAEKAEQEKLEKQKKYQTFLKQNGYSDETEHNFLIQRNGSTIFLYKKVAEYEI